MRLYRCLHLRDRPLCDRASKEIGDARVLRPALPRPPVDAHDAAATDSVADAGKEVSGAAEPGPGLDDELGALLEQNLLIDPDVERTLERPHPEPVRIAPGPALVIE